jgi:16S rRNA (adenine1518-N6/adenine1519-N6)-dimethyltransferase
VTSSGHRPKRSLGQNFLVDPNLQRKIVAALDAGPDDTVLEIGPGREALTRHLAGTVGRLVLVELDDDLAAALSVRYQGRDDVEVVHRDILDVSPEALVADPGSLRVVGNVPYNITTPILFHLLERPRPRDMVLMVQDEVADRIVAPPGSSAYGALAVGVQSVADAEKLFRVGRQAFRPVPGVDSAVVRIRPRVPPPLEPAEEERLRHLVRACFQWRRKQLRKILRDHPDLGVPAEEIPHLAETVGFRPTDRPETLSPEQFASLAATLPDPTG